jgi:hypothetical protein
VDKASALPGIRGIPDVSTVAVVLTMTREPGNDKHPGTIGMGADERSEVGRVAKN